MTMVSCANWGKIVHVPSTFQRAIAHLKAREKLNFIVIMADFQIADQKQKCFLKEMKNEIPLTPLFYAFLRG